MGCYCSRNQSTLEDMELDELKNIRSDYIKLHKQISNKNTKIDENIYLVETDFFQKLCENFSINLNNIENLNDDILNSEIKKFPNNLRFPLIKIIENQDEIKTPNIELITEKILELLKFLKLDEIKYIDKNVEFKKLQDEKIELVFKNGTRITIIYTKEKIPFKVNNNENYNLKNKDHLSNQNNVIANQNPIIYNSSLNNAILKYENFYLYYSQLFNDLKELDNLMKRQIDSFKKYNDYVIISKANYNYLTKLFENNDLFYSSDIIDSYEKITPITKVDNNIIDIERRIKKYIKNDSFLHLDMKLVVNTDLNYLENFILIKKDLLKKFGVDDEKMINNIFDIFIGENYIYIDIDKKMHNKIIICSRDKFFFNTNIIIKCLEKLYFENEVIKFIKNKGGFEYFFSKKGFDMNNKNHFRDFDEETPIGEIRIINYKSNIIDTNDTVEEKETKINLLYEQIIISLNSIKQLSGYLNEKEINFLLNKYIYDLSPNNENDTKNNKSNDDSLIKDKNLREIENLIKLRNKNNFKDIIDTILDIIHLKLGGKKIDENDEGNDRNYICDTFKNNFNKINNTIIKNLFFGIILNTTIPICCKEKIYKCDLSKFIYLNHENIKNYNNLNDILENWDFSETNLYFCQRCYSDNEADIKKVFIEYPNILIIILNDEKEKEKKSIEFPFELDISKFAFKYKLINVISSPYIYKDFKNIKCENNKWILLDKTNKKLNQEELKLYTKYPRVFFYEKIKKGQKEIELDTKTEKKVDDFFNASIITKTLKPNDTRINNSMRCFIDNIVESNNDFELIKRNNNNSTKIEENEYNNLNNVNKNNLRYDIKNTEENQNNGLININIINSKNKPLNGEFGKNDNQSYANVDNKIINEYYDNDNMKDDAAFKDNKKEINVNKDFTHNLEKNFNNNINNN